MSTRTPDNKPEKMIQDLENALSEAKQLLHENQSDRSSSGLKDAFGEIAFGIGVIAIAIFMHFLFPSLNHYALEIWSSLIAFIVAVRLIIRFNRNKR